MRIAAVYPTPEHAQAAQSIVAFFSTFSETEAVILTGSCARGKASPDSCLDILILLRPEVFLSARETLGRRWEDFYGATGTFPAACIPSLTTSGSVSRSKRSWGCRNCIRTWCASSRSVISRATRLLVRERSWNVS